MMVTGTLEEEVREVPVNTAHQTVYIGGEESQEIWEKAREKWGGSMSSLIMELLKDFVRTTEEEEK